MNDSNSGWDAIVSLCENNKNPDQWGYDVDSSGRKILAKKFTLSNTKIYDFTIYRLERMIDNAWDDAVHDQSDAYVLAEILEAYLSEDVYVEWVEGFPMAIPNVSDSDFFEELEFDPFS